MAFYISFKGVVLAISLMGIIALSVIGLLISLGVIPNGWMGFVL